MIQSFVHLVTKGSPRGLGYQSAELAGHWNNRAEFSTHKAENWFEQGSVWFRFASHLRIRD
jgi:hypothetical protein